MIGVKFTRSMAPYGPGDTALLPEAVAQTLVDENSAELYEFPASPHSAAVLKPSDVKVVHQPMNTETRQQRYRTKGR